MKYSVFCMKVFICLMLSDSLIASEMPLLARKNGCTDCHAIDKKIIGPAWMAVSKKYRNAKVYEYRGLKYSLVDGLVMKVSKGGSGNWGTIPMPMNDPLFAKHSDIKPLVQFIIGLAK